eukprot:SAG31_NODE_3299_length_4445_cov_3.190520_6_plen_192_part_00
MVSAYTQAVVAGGLGKTGRSNAAEKLQRRVADERKNEARKAQHTAQQEAEALALSTKSNLTPAEQEFVDRQEAEWAAKRKVKVDADLAARDAKVTPFDPAACVRHDALSNDVIPVSVPHPDRTRKHHIAAQQAETRRCGPCAPSGVALLVSSVHLDRQRSHFLSIRIQRSPFLVPFELPCFACQKVSAGAF